MNCEKLIAFYETDLGHHVKNVLAHKLLNRSAFQGETVICTLGAYPIIGNNIKTQDRTFFQNYGTEVFKDNHNHLSHIVNCNKNEWPYRAESIDKVVMVHDVEFVDDLDSYLREAWRVLKGEGAITMVVPNRQSSWTRSDQTPFGYGQLCHLKSIQSALEKNRFSVDKMSRCLFFPPYAPKTKIGELTRSMIESVGEYMGLKGGLYVLEVSKHVYAPLNGLKQTVRNPAEHFIPTRRPKPAGKVTSRSSQ